VQERGRDSDALSMIDLKGMLAYCFGEVRRMNMMPKKRPKPTHGRAWANMT